MKTYKNTLFVCRKREHKWTILKGFGTKRCVSMCLMCVNKIKEG